jgi:activating signal cointegrator 1
MEDAVRALSLTQPWATAIIIGVKQIETRSWYTSHRRCIAIHAAKGFPGWAKEFAATEHTLGRLPGRFPRGAIIGLATIQDVRRTEALRGSISALERLYGDYDAGRWGWVLTDIRALPEPITCKGALGLWAVPQEIMALIKATVTE